MSSSSSATSSCCRRRHEVFMSFRGEDTRNNFVSHLYTALDLNGMKTFKDDGIPKGLDINSALSQQIEESQIAVIVFSKNYSDSSWCLDELVKIMDCHQKKRLKVHPVFYDVNPSDAGSKVRNQCRGNSYCDLDYVNNCIDENLIGIDRRMRKMMPLNLCEHGVGMIGILGMPGSGKTTIARAVFDDMCEQFDGHCFVYNISEVSKKQGLVFLQKQILSSVLGHEKVQMSDTYEGCKKMKRWLSRIKVLIVLDNVDSGEQLEALVGARNWFGDGSRIIITTTDERLLVAHKLVDRTYNVILLNYEEAIQLLNSCAFQNGIPTEAHKESLERVIRYAAGHPGALKCLGSKLINKKIHEWEDTIDSLATCPEAKIDNMIKLNLEGLNTWEKELFLDIACFFNGWVKDEVVDILDSCGLFPTSGLGTLKEKSLITFSREFIQMHNLVLQTGRNIVRQEHPDDPSRQSRLWHPEEVKDLLVENRGTEYIKAIVISNLKKLDARAAFDAFASMKELRLLHANTQRTVFLVHGSTCVSVQWIMEGSGCLKHLPCDLKWLTWDHFNLESWPIDFHAKKLVGGLQMRHSSIRDLCSGRDMKFLGKLKFLDLSFSKDLIRTPNFRCLTHLEKLNLEFCSSLVEVHPSIGDHSNLVHLNLRSCEKLESLPSSLEMRSLKVLNLSWCSKLTKMPDFVGMTNLLELDLSHNTVEELPTSIGDLPGLIYLDISNCRNLTSIPQSIWMLNNRAEIILYGCPFSEDCLVRPQQ